MSREYCLCCGDCFEFIDLHKWWIIEGIAICFAEGSERDRFTKKLNLSLSNQAIIEVTAQQLSKSLIKPIPSQPYIIKLLPIVKQFIANHQHHYLFFCCDEGEFPWDIGEPQWQRWKEIPVALAIKVGFYQETC